MQLSAALGYLLAFDVLLSSVAFVYAAVTQHWLVVFITWPRVALYALTLYVAN